MPILEVNEGSTQTFTVVVKNDSDVAVVPTVATYTLTDRDGVVIQSGSGLDLEDIVMTPSVSMTVVLAGIDLQILDSTSFREYRLLTIKTDRGDVAKPENIEYEFWVKNLKAITNQGLNDFTYLLRFQAENAVQNLRVVGATSYCTKLLDTSGNGYDAVQATEASQMVYDATNKKLVADGVDDYFANASFVQAQPFTVYFVADVTADTTTRVLFGDANVRAMVSTSNTAGIDAGTPVFDLSPTITGSKKLFAIQFNTTTSIFYVDGIAVLETSIGTDALAAFGIGADNTGANPTAMDFYACFVTAGSYSSTLNATIESYYGV